MMKSHSFFQKRLLRFVVFCLLLVVLVSSGRLSAQNQTCIWTGSWDVIPPATWSDTLTIDVVSGTATLTASSYTGDVLIVNVSSGADIEIAGDLTTTGNQIYNGEIKTNLPTINITSDTLMLQGSMDGNVISISGSSVLVQNSTSKIDCNDLIVNASDNVEIQGTIDCSNALTVTTDSCFIIQDSATNVKCNILTVTSGDMEVQGMIDCDKFNITSTGNLYTIDSAKIKGREMTLTLSGTTNSSVGTATHGIDANGDAATIISPLRIFNCDTLRVSTQSGTNGDGTPTGNVLIDHQRNNNKKLYVHINTNGDRSDADIASVVLRSDSAILGIPGVATHIDAKSADIKTTQDIDNINTNVKYLAANTTISGNIIINNSSSSALTLFGADAKEFGNVAVPIAAGGDIKVYDGKNYVSGTKSVNITTAGNMIILGHVSAPNQLSLASTAGNIYTISEESNQFAIIGNYISLVADSNVGLWGSMINTFVGNRIDAIAANGGVFINDHNRLPIGIITTAANHEIVLNTLAGNLNFAYSDSKISAPNGNVTLTASAGGILASNATTNKIEADTVILTSKKNIGTASTPIAIDVPTIFTTVEDVGGDTYIKDNHASTSALSVSTAGGHVDINSATPLVFNEATGDLQLTNSASLSLLSFTNSKGNLRLKGIKIGNGSLTLKASGNISQVSDTLIAGKADISAGGNIGGDAPYRLHVSFDTVNMVSDTGSIQIEQYYKGVVYSAATKGLGRKVELYHLGKVTDSIIVKKLQIPQQNATGSIDVQCKGIIVAAPLEQGDYHIAGGGSVTILSQTTGNSIGTDMTPLTFNCSDSLQIEANGSIYANNANNLQHFGINAYNSGHVNFANIGNIADFGGGISAQNHNINLNVRGTITVVTPQVVMEADTLTIKATGIVKNGVDELHVCVKALIAECSSGNFYLWNKCSNPLFISSVSVSGDVEIKTDGLINLGTIAANGHSVTLVATGDILDARLSGETKSNVKASSLNITGVNLGTTPEPLRYDVSMLHASASGNQYTENRVPVHITSNSLTGNTSAAVEHVAPSITIFDNNGGSTTIANNGSLKLTALQGNITFFNPEDQIEITGTGTVEMSALGTTLPPGETGAVGNIVVGRLLTAGGNITLQAAKHVGFNVLNVGTGKVTLAANGGYLISLAAAQTSIIADSIILSGNEVTPEQLLLDLGEATTDVITKTTSANIYNDLQTIADKEVKTLQNLVEHYQNLETTSDKTVETKKKSFESAEIAYKAAYGIMYVISVGLEVAEVIFALAEIPAAAAQIFPFSGDAGAHLAHSIAKAAVVVALIKGFHSIAEGAVEVAAGALADARQELSEARAEDYANKELYYTNNALLIEQVKTFEHYEAKYNNAQNAALASRQLSYLFTKAFNTKNQIGTPDHPITFECSTVSPTNSINAVASTKGDIYLHSSKTISLGHLDAQGEKSCIGVRAQHSANAADIRLSQQVKSNGKLLLYAPKGAIVTSSSAPSPLLVTDSLVLLATEKISHNTVANPLPIQANYLALEDLTTPSGTLEVNLANQGSFPVAITDIPVKEFGLNKIVSGITAGGKITFSNANDIIIKSPLRNNSVVTLTSSSGAITGADISSHVYPLTPLTNIPLTINAANGIGSQAIPLRTHINTIDATITNVGGIWIEETDNLQIENISMPDNAGNDVDIKASNIDLNCNIAAGKTHSNIHILSANKIRPWGLYTIIGHTLKLDAQDSIGNPTYVLTTQVDSLSAITNNGAIYLHEIDSLYISNVKTNNGDIKFSGEDNLYVLNMETINSGKIEFIGEDSLHISNMKTKNGDIKFSGGKELYVLNMEITNSGNIEFTGRDSLYISNMKTENGNIKFSGENDLYVLNMEITNSGNIEFTGEDSLHISNMKTKNGDIKFSGENDLYVLNMEITNSGNIEFTGEDSLHISNMKTENGNIKFSGGNDLYVLNMEITNSGNIEFTGGDSLYISNMKTENGNIEFTGEDSLYVSNMETANGNIKFKGEDSVYILNMKIANNGKIEFTSGDNLYVSNMETANGNIELTGGDVLLDNVITHGSGHQITIGVKSILTVDTLHPIVTDTLNITAQTGIGSIDNPIRTFVLEMDGENTNGHSFIVNSRQNLNISRFLNATGNLTLTSPDTIFVEGIVSFDTLYMTAVNGAILDTFGILTLSGGNAILVAPSGVGSKAFPLTASIAKLDVTIDSADLVINAVSDIELEKLNISQGVIRVQSTDNIHVATSLFLTDSVIFKADSVFFYDSINTVGYPFMVTGIAKFNPASFFKINNQWIGKTDTLYVDGDVNISDLTVFAANYAGKTYDIIISTGNITGETNVVVPHFVASVVNLGNGNKALRLTSVLICDTVIDYDGNKYASTGIGCNCWTVRNLESTHYADGRPVNSYIYYHDRMYPDTLINLATYGRLYEWGDATDTATNFTQPVQGVCPNGWRLPTQADYLDLIHEGGAIGIRDTVLWLPPAYNNNFTAFSALPAGYYDATVNRYYRLRGDAYFWYAEQPPTPYLGKAIHLLYGCPEVYLINFNKINGASVRCVKQ